MSARLSAPPFALAAAVFGCVTIASLAAVDGGFFAASWPWALVGLGAAFAMAVLLRGRLTIDTNVAVFAGALAALAIWTALSATWAADAPLALREAERTLVYVVGILAALALVTRESAPYLLGGIVAAATAVAIVSLARGAGREDPLEGPIGYANALGILAAVGIVLAVGGALHARRPVIIGLAVVAVVPLVVALALSESRASALALGIGLAGAAMLARRARKLVLAVSIVGAALLAVAVSVGSRFSLGDRPHYWRVAWAQFEDNPLHGDGAGAFHLYWLERRPDPASLATPDVLDAHSLYLETLAELGLVGFALVLVALAVPVAAAAEGRKDAAVAVAAPAYAAFLVHAGLDWDWEMPAVTLAGLFLATVLLRAGRDAAPGAG
ncbi:MAG TPA: O-antigen ligase family protein [Gaiellaceae bacterium]|nr:O-antigen ligase family protein [Gaiellaceae bacterium]